MIFDLRVPLIGEHFAINAGFACLAAYFMGVPEDDIREGLASYVPTGMRMNIYENDGITVLADCYNAAPESMRGALDTLSSIEVKGRRVAVLGDMKELGATSDSLHRRVGKYLHDKGIDLLFTFGESAALIAEGAIDAGFDEKNVISQTNLDKKADLAARIKDTLKVGDAVLFKASRSMKLEELIEAIFGN